MQVFAKVDDGVVTEIVRINPGDPDLDKRYHRDILKSFVRITGQQVNIIQPGWLYDGNSFYQKPPPPPPAPEDIDEPEDELPPENVKTIPLYRIQNKLRRAGLWDKFTDELMKRPRLLVSVMFSDGSARSDNAQLRSLLNAIGSNVDVILGKDK